MINQQLAELSNLAIVVTIVLYVLALIGFGADLASSSQRRSDARLAAQERKEAQEREMSPASVGASGVEAEGARGRLPPGPAACPRSASPSCWPRPRPCCT